MTNASNTQTKTKANLPTHVAKSRSGKGRNASFERIGVAWKNDDGSFYIKLYGTQVVENFTLYEMSAPQEEAAEKAPTQPAPAPAEAAA